MQNNKNIYPTRVILHMSVVFLYFYTNFYKSLASLYVPCFLPKSNQREYKRDHLSSLNFRYDTGKPVRLFQSKIANFLVVDDIILLKSVAFF